MKIALVDDDIVFLNYIHSYLSSLNFPDVTQFSNPVNFIENLNSSNYDLILLDIEMPNLDGIQILKYIQENQKNVYIIFVSHEDKYIEDCFDMNVLGFIKKDKIEDKLHTLLLKAKNYLTPILINFETKYNCISIDVNDIAYFDVSYRKVFIVLINGDKILLRSRVLNEVQEIMHNYNFFLINRSTLINLNKVISFDNNYINLINVKKKLELSRYRKNDFIIAYTKSRLNGNSNVCN
ncbi:MAG: LytTR family DNA-binding domain-containing protein [Bacilli bacterium]